MFLCCVAKGPQCIEVTVYVPRGVLLAEAVSLVAFSTFFLAFRVSMYKPWCSVYVCFTMLSTALCFSLVNNRWQTTKKTKTLNKKRWTFLWSLSTRGMLAYTHTRNMHSTWYKTCPTVHIRTHFPTINGGNELKYLRCGVTYYNTFRVRRWNERFFLGPEPWMYLTAKRETNSGFMS